MLIRKDLLNAIYVAQLLLGSDQLLEGFNYERAGHRDRLRTLIEMGRLWHAPKASTYTLREHIARVHTKEEDNAEPIMASVTRRRTLSEDRRLRLKIGSWRERDRSVMHLSVCIPAFAMSGEARIDEAIDNRAKRTFRDALGKIREPGAILLGLGEGQSPGARHRARSRSYSSVDASAPAVDPSVPYFQQLPPQSPQAAPASRPSASAVDASAVGSPGLAGGTAPDQSQAPLNFYGLRSGRRAPASPLGAGLLGSGTAHL